MTTLLLIPTRLEWEGLSPLKTGDAEVRLCGMGPLAAGVAAVRWLEETRPSSCILVGLAGTRDPVRAALGCVVVGTAVRNEAVGSGHGGSFQPLSAMVPAGEDVAPDPLALAVPVDWLSIAMEPERDGLSPGGIVAGEIGTVAAASASIEEADAWLAHDPAVLVEEMEGYAVALACRAAGTPLSIVRGVSNRAGTRDKDRWELSRAMTALRGFLEQALGGPPR